jgi:hypothetical protein
MSPAITGGRLNYASNRIASGASGFSRSEIDSDRTKRTCT